MLEAGDICSDAAGTDLSSGLGRLSDPGQGAIGTSTALIVQSRTVCACLVPYVSKDLLESIGAALERLHEHGVKVPRRRFSDELECGLVC